VIRLGNRLSLWSPQADIRKDRQVAA
jgi:hypothetical protein